MTADLSATSMQLDIIVASNQTNCFHFSIEEMGQKRPHLTDSFVTFSACLFWLIEAAPRIISQADSVLILSFNLWACSSLGESPLCCTEYSVVAEQITGQIQLPPTEKHQCCCHAASGYYLLPSQLHRTRTVGLGLEQFEALNLTRLG